jgi:hypothetical protein
MYLDSEIWTAQFTLIASDTSIGIHNLGDKTIKFQNFGGAERDADTAPLTVPLVNLNSRFRTHERPSPLSGVLCFIPI